MKIHYSWEEFNVWHSVMVAGIDAPSEHILFVAYKLCAYTNFWEITMNNVQGNNNEAKTTHFEGANGCVDVNGQEVKLDSTGQFVKNMWGDGAAEDPFSGENMWQ